MRYLILTLLTICVVNLKAQSVDSVAVRQTDSLVQLSGFYLDLGNTDHAFQVLESAEKMARQKIGIESPAYGTCSHNFGKIYAYKRDLINAEKWYKKAITIREKVFGKENDHYIESVFDLANLYKLKGENQKAEVLFREITNINKQRLKKAQGYLSESELNSFLNRLLPIEHQILSFMQSEGAKDLTASLYDNSHFIKASYFRRPIESRGWFGLIPGQPKPTIFSRKKMSNWPIYTAHHVHNGTPQ